MTTRDVGERLVGGGRGRHKGQGLGYGEGVTIHSGKVDSEEDRRGRA